MSKGVKYKRIDKSYFESREFKRHAAVVFPADGINALPTSAQLKNYDGVL